MSDPDTSVWTEYFRSFPEYQPAVLDGNGASEGTPPWSPWGQRDEPDGDESSVDPDPGWQAYAQLVTGRIAAQGQTGFALARYVGCELRRLRPLWGGDGHRVLPHVPAVSQFCVDWSGPPPADAGGISTDGWRHFGELSRRLREVERVSLENLATRLSCKPDDLRRLENGAGVGFPELVASVINTHSLLGRDITGFGPDERHVFLEVLRLRAGQPTQRSIAGKLGIPWQNVNAVFRGRETLTKDMFLRILAVLRTGLPEGISEDDVLRQLGYESLRDLALADYVPGTAESELIPDTGLTAWLTTARLMRLIHNSDRKRVQAGQSLVGGATSDL